MSSKRNKVSGFARALFAAALAAAAAVACSRQTAPAADAEPQEKRYRWEVQAPDELFSLLHGMVVTDRSGELWFEACTLFSADGDDATYWTTPPGDLHQWMLVELPAKSVIRKLGASNAQLVNKPRAVKELRFETSLDGKTYSELKTITLEKSKDDQLFDVAPTEARFMRVSIVSNFGNPDIADVPSILVRGSELEPPAPVEMSGRWKVNNDMLDLVQDGRSVKGVLNVDPPMLISGAIEGRIARFTWSRGPAFGIGYLAINPERTKMNGIWWHEQTPDVYHLGEVWYGDRVGEPAQFDVPIQKIAQTHIGKAAKFPLYQMVFAPDGSIDRAGSRAAFDFIRLAIASFPQFRVRLEVAEFGDKDESKNLAVSRDRAKSLSAALAAEQIPADRIVVEAVGSPLQLADRSKPFYRAMYTRVDFALSGK